jgi:serine protease Do
LRKRRNIRFAPLLNYTTMKTPLVFTLVLTWSLAWLAAREPARNIDDLVNLERKVSDVAIKAMPATVALVSDKLGSSGSGVIVSEEGLILTAAHVIQGAKEISVIFPNGRQTEGKVLGANYSKDIGMVQILEKGPWPFMEQGVSKSLEAGDWVIAMGHAAGYDAARTPPIRFGRVMSKGPGNFLTTDCKLIGGDSGGPLYDLEGRVVGINSSIGVSLQNNNHAGIDGFKVDWDRLLAGESWGELQMNPLMNQERPVLGIGTAETRGRGVGVSSVRKGGPAAKAGIKRYDIIVSIDGAEIRDRSSLEENIIKRQAGDKVKVGIVRDEQNLEVEVELVTLESLMTK